MIKRSLLNVNFSDEENSLIETALEKTDTNVDISKVSLNELGLLRSNMANVSLVMIKLNENVKQNSALLKQVKNQFIHFPIILVAGHELNAKEISRYDLVNIIDIRDFNPLFLLVKSITREFKSQYNKHQFHKVQSQFKNESYRLDAFLKHTEDGVALIYDGQYWSTNDAYKRIFGIPEDEYLINTPVLEFTSPTTCPVKGNLAQKNLNTSLETLPNETILSVLIQTRDNESFVTTLYKTHCFVKNVLCTQLLVHNPDAWSNVDKGFTDLRTFDHNTGLYNKRFAIEYIDRELQSSEPHGSLAIILIDDFRAIRERYSLDYIDEIIRSVASTINESCSKSDVLARYNDAVFTLFSNESDQSKFLLNCQKILTDVNTTLFGDDSQYIRLSLSIGVGFIGAGTSNSKELISQADKACDKAASLAGNQIHVFDSVTTPLTALIDEEKNTRLIHTALEQNRLHLLYQPIVNLSEESTANYAVLLRILDENNEHIPPDHFILTAEKTGLISALDEWVLKNTITQIRAFSRQGLKRKFFISLSKVTYRDRSFLETLVSDINLYNIDASLLVFQINFSDVKTDPIGLKQFIAVIKKECGCQLAFDQIGFEHISDAMLKEYGVDYLKIDGSFSQNLLNDKESQAIIKNIIEVTRRNHVTTIAKSVENANTLALLWNIGIDAVQGYFLQKPADSMCFDFDLNN
jgi:diguanylate cyclase (GGDEF)-like protein